LHIFNAHARTWLIALQTFPGQDVSLTSDCPGNVLSGKVIARETSVTRLIYTSGLKSDVTIVYVDPVGILAIRP